MESLEEVVDLFWSAVHRLLGWLRRPQPGAGAAHMPKVDVIDISHWQGDPDWGWVKANLSGVILKCTEGLSNVDQTFQRRRQYCLDNDIPHATYHFLRPGPVVPQINHYLNTLKPRRGERVVLDHEDEGFSLQDLKAAVQYLITDDRELEITIYSGHLIKQQLGDNPNPLLTEHTSLWLAQYGDTPSWPTKVWEKWSLWQFSDKGQAAGYQRVDVNTFNGTPENCRKWLGPAAPAAPVDNGNVATPTKAEVVIDMTVPENVDVVVKLNGRFLL